MAAVENDIYSEWASGASLANTSQNFFEEIPTELAHPSNFSVPEDQLPESGTLGSVVNPQIPEVTEPPVQDDGPQVRDTKSGGTASLEKTSKGWKLTLDPKVSNLSVENFYGPNKDELIFNFADSKIEANKTIHRLKKEKLLGGEEAKPKAPVAPRSTASVNVLSADDAYAIKNKLNSDDPAQVAEAFDEWVSKRFKMSPEQLADALNSAPEAKRIVESQRVKSEVEDVNKEFVERNPDYLEFVSNEEDEVNRANSRLLIGRISKVYLNKKVTKSTSQTIVDDLIYELFSKGFWTVENLESAKEELIENGLFERSTAPVRNSKPQPQQVAIPQDSPSEPAAPRIAATPGQQVGVSLGIPAKSSTPVAVPDAKPLTDTDLQKLPLEQLRAIAAAQLQAMNR